LSIRTLLVALTLLFPLLGAWAQAPAPGGGKALDFKWLKASEAGSSFSLRVGVAETADSSGDNDDDEYGFRGPGGSRFDSVALYDYVRVHPATNFSISVKRNSFILVGDFRPNTKYKVTLKKGLASKEGAQLMNDATKDVKTPDFRPRFTFTSKARYLLGSLQGSLGYESVNVKSARFQVRQVYPQNMHQWLTSGEYANEYVGDVIKTVVVPIGARKNNLKAGTFSLKEFETLGQGVFVIQASPPPKNEDEKNKTARGEASEQEGDEAAAAASEDEQATDDSGHFGDTATVIVTNLSVVAKRGPQQVKVWVVGTKDLAPVRDAQVDLLSISNRKLDSCRTSGPNAECALSWKKTETQPYAIVVRSGKDMTYLRFEDLTLPNDAFHAGRREYAGVAGGLDAYIYPERDLYRPGEIAHLAAMVRNHSFEAVPKLPLRWTITNPKGKVVRETVSDTDEFGLAELDYPSTPANETGKYTIAVSSGNKVLHEIGVMIEEFVPERIGIKVAPAAELVIGRTSANFTINANYLFGPPVAHGAYAAACSMVPAFKSIPNRADYSTGVYSREPKQPLTLEAKTGALDAKGAAQAICEWAGATGAKLAEAFELRMKVDVTEAGSGRAATKWGKTFVASTDTLIGLKLDGSKGRTLEIRGGLFDFKGQTKAKPMKVKLQLFNIREHWYYTYGGGGDSWKAEEMVTPTGVEKTVDVANGAFEVALDTPSDMWGRWLVRAVDTQTGYAADLDAGYGGGWWYGEGRQAKGSRAPEPSALKVEVSKQEVSPGEKIEAMVNAPFAGRVLFAFETDKVLETHWVEAKKPGPVKIELRVPDALPNVYLTALLLKNPSEDGGKRFMPARAWGAASLQVIPEAHRMRVDVTHPEISESRRQVAIQISNDRKIAAEYSLALVDEGILQITDFKSPVPLKRFFEARAMGVGSAETIGWTVADAGSSKTPGGDESKGAGSKNMPVRLVAFWFPKIKSDSSGRAEAKVDLPPFQGRLRVMAVASAKSRMGSSSSFMTVRDPLVLQPTLPRFLTFGDKFQFPVQVTNLSGKDQTVTVEITPGPLVKVATLKQELAIPNGQSKIARFESEVKGVSGLAHIGVKAVSADGKLSSVDDFDLPVKPAGVEQTVRLAFDAKQEVPLGPQLPGEWLTDFVRVEASVSNMPYLNQIGQLDMLLHYPYGCIEQTTSATMPLLVIGELLKWADPKKAGKVDVKDMVNRGIARVLSMQTAGGGFGYWPGDNNPNPWGSAYATHLLLDAKKLGYDVPPTAVKNALDYLESYVRNTDYHWSWQWVAYVSEQADPFALYVLAKGGRSVTQELRNAVRGLNKTNAVPQDKIKGIAGENYFLLAATAKLIGDKESIRILNNEAIFSVPLTGERDQGYTYWSPMRSDGLRLSVLEDLWPQNAAGEVLAQRVASSLARNGVYYSTQDVAWAVLGLGKRLNGMKKVDASRLARVGLKFNGKPVAKSFEFEGFPGFVYEGPNQVSSKIQLSDAPDEKGVFLYVKATGYTKSPPRPKSGFAIARRFLSRDGAPANLNAVKQGDTLFVELSIENKLGGAINNVAIVDRLPAGFEIENPRLGKSEDLQWMKEPFAASYQDMRDDRIQVFGDFKGKTTETVYYSVRAVTKGKFTAPASFVEAMYDPANFNYGQDAALQIVDAAAAK